MIAVVLTLILGLALSARSQTVLIKMGDNSTYQGTNAPSPDINGNYWNSVDSSQFSPVLTNIDGTVGTEWAVAFGFETNAVGNTGASNGPAGPVPPGTPPNASLRPARSATWALSRRCMTITSIPNLSFKTCIHRGRTP
jgi:hypothetical protein